VSTLVREVQPAEQAAVADLTASVYRGEGFASADYEPSLRDVAARVQTATVLVAVDDDDGNLLGAVTVATRGGEWAEQSAPGEAVVRMLVVAAAGRGRGTGEALVRACLDRAREDGCSVVRLSSMLAMHAAHRLYERLGFVRTPSLDWQPVPGLQLLTYALPLVPFCDQCGEPLTAPSLATSAHDRCGAARELEPPRYCGQCRRRMVVQVHPTGWTARCSEHGERSAS
jgi:ribosomal protein S18 acetylase RimI-like enzyme